MRGGYIITYERDEVGPILLPYERIRVYPLRDGVEITLKARIALYLPLTCTL